MRNMLQMGRWLVVTTLSQIAESLRGCLWIRQKKVFVSQNQRTKVLKFAFSCIECAAFTVSPVAMILSGRRADPERSKPWQ